MNTLNPNVGPLQTTEREQKHIAIDSALDRLESSVSRLRDLRDRISGDGQCEPARDPEKNQRSLEQVLNQAPDDIRSRAGQINDLITEIESLLF